MLKFIYKIRVFIEFIIIFFGFYFTISFGNFISLRNQHMGGTAGVVYIFGLLILGFFLTPRFNKLTKNVTDKRKKFLYHILFLLSIIAIIWLFLVIYRILEMNKLT